jgi:hypothetical protein
MLIPAPYKWLALALLLAATAGAGWVKGAANVHTAWDLADARREAATAKRQVRVGNAVAAVVTRYVDRIQVVREAGQTIIQEVPVYVSQDADHHCPVPAGFVRLWNGANRGELPAPDGPADAAASPVVLTDIAAQHGREAEQCRAVEEQLIALQDAVREAFAP